MESIDIVIVGAGFGGIGLGHKLKEAGLDSFLILEKADEVGGTWRDNTYPGAECDVPSFFYSYSFAPNPDWQHKWSKQSQIFDYQKKCARDFGLYPHIRFGQEAKTASFDEATGRWTVTTDTGDRIDCRHFICALGQLHHPSIPKVKGQDDFEGQQFHSATWPEGVDLKGKNVAVVGNAASALQFIPYVAEQATKATVYQRTPNWVMPKGNRPYTAFEKWLSRHVPPLARLYRLGQWLRTEYVVFPIIAGSRPHQMLGRSLFRRNLNKAVSDPELRAKLTPDYPLGAKRLLISDTLFPALARDNVEVVTEGIDHISADGITDKSGTSRPHDFIIYGTGFQTNPFIQSIDVTGRGGKTLREVWKEGARAYLGIAVPGFPNLHMLYGPNTNTGHSSVVYMMEAQIGYIVQLIQQASTKTAEVREDVATRFDTEMQTRLTQSVWDKIETSWYKDGGRITNNWPGSGREYHRRTKRLVPQDFVFSDPQGD
ncbi:NAD(P)/FAD-dependent oxidoreductase [Ruegeria sp. 2012CJ41-6]|uniref:NAD(P)/FAD-dependent oxidoreductase n=1 Tax=Ruegeria spongiae TaxID=2942209 RepID=A0ABT0Q1V2_9RHOB|nr:NAD(P)/FAD-dependent oxidoreductase [Ruegeria spongiae]MCL6283855.1 NAD(P)/FAD-dependent oxidoreductase [Ruegeria spongiae]